jgi:hypothetical protein
MKSYFKILVVFALVTTITIVQAKTATTKRIEQFANQQVKVWKTVIYPRSNQSLTMHRHEYNRVLVALTNGLLKITNDKGKVHYLRLKKDKAYYLKKDTPNELHKDENLTQFPIKVMVIELK